MEGTCMSDYYDALAVMCHNSNVGMVPRSKDRVYELERTTVELERFNERMVVYVRLDVNFASRMVYMACVYDSDDDYGTFRTIVKQFKDDDSVHRWVAENGKWLSRNESSVRARICRSANIFTGTNWL